MPRVTAPSPLTLRFTVAACLAKLAVTVWLVPVGMNVQLVLVLPETQGPAKPRKVLPEAAVPLRVTDLLSKNVSEQVSVVGALRLHAIPVGLDITVPVPAPVLITW